MDQMALRLIDVGVKRSERWLLREITWSVPAGACCAVLGPNGSGKSTLARVISGYLYPTCGAVHVLGRTFGETDLAELRRHVRLLQPAGPFDADPALSARQVVLSGFFGTIGLFHDLTPAQRDEADAALRDVGLADRAAQPYFLMSTGERVRTLMARSLVGEPRLLLLDEPTSGLDFTAREHVVLAVTRLLQTRPGLTVVIITHHPEELPACTHSVLLLDEGRIADSGAPATVLTPARLSEVFRSPIRVRVENGRYWISAG